MSEGSKSNGAVEVKRLTAEDLADRTRFRFREKTLEIPEIGGEIVLKSLSVREREMLPDPRATQEVDDKGERTAAAIRSAAQVFACIVAEPKVDAETAEQFLGDWPVEAFDSVTAAYAELVGTAQEEKAAYATFPGEDGPDQPGGGE